MHLDPFQTTPRASALDLAMVWEDQWPEFFPVDAAFLVDPLAWLDYPIGRDPGDTLRSGPFGWGAIEADDDAAITSVWRRDDSSAWDLPTAEAC